jgi:putative ABC transport system ATP-binding protein
VQGQEVKVDRLAALPGQTVVLSGGGVEARLALMRLAAGLERAQGGGVMLGGLDLAVMNPAELGASIGVLTADSLILAGSLRFNVEYALFRNAPALLSRQGADAAVMRREARRTGMPPHDPDGDWVDYAAAGCTDAADLRHRIIELADMAGMSGDLIAAALNTPLARAGGPEGLGALTAARGSVDAAITRNNLDSFVERWSRDAMSENATLLENMLFALPDDPATTHADILREPGVRRALAQAKGLALLADIGADLARAFASLAATVSPDSPLLDKVGSFARADILGAQAIAGKVPQQGSATRDKVLRQQLIEWGGRYTPVRDRFDAMTPERCAAVMAVRRTVLAGEPVPGFTRLDSATPAASLTVAEALLGGRRRENRRAGWRRLEMALVAAITEAGQRDALIAVGLDAPIEAAVTPGMRQRIALMRVAVKQPRLVAVLADGLAEDAEIREFLRRALPEAILLLASDDPAVQGEADVRARLDGDGVLRLEADSMGESSAVRVERRESLAQGGT